MSYFLRKTGNEVINQIFTNKPNKNPIKKWGEKKIQKIKIIPFDEPEEIHKETELKEELKEELKPKNEPKENINLLSSIIETEIPEQSAPKGFETELKEELKEELIPKNEPKENINLLSSIIETEIQKETELKEELKEEPKKIKKYDEDDYKYSTEPNARKRYGISKWIKNEDEYNIDKILTKRTGTNIYIPNLGEFGLICKYFYKKNIKNEKKIQDLIDFINSN